MSLFKSHVLRYFQKNAAFWFCQIDSYFANKIDTSRLKLLDVGCGRGYLVKFFEENGYQAQGIELSGVDKESLAKIRCDFYDGKKLPYDDNSFDIVIAKYVLHHASDRESLLQEMMRVSRNYIVVIEETYSNRWQKIALYLYDLYYNLLGNSKIDFHFDNYFQKGELEQTMTRHGLSTGYNFTKTMNMKPYDVQMIIGEKG